MAPPQSDRLHHSLRPSRWNVVRDELGELLPQSPFLSLADHAIQKPFDVNLLDSIMTLMTFLLPFQLPIAAVWIRNLLNDWHQMPKMDHGLLQTLPLFLLLAFIVEQRGTGHLVQRYGRL